MKAAGAAISSGEAGVATPAPQGASRSKGHELRAWIQRFALHRPLWALGIGVGALGLLSRFVLAWFSVGCDDAQGWHVHGKLIRAQGLRYAYEHTANAVWKYNHPPLMGYWSAFADWASGSKPHVFSLWMKAPGLAAELLSAWLIYRIAAKHSANSGAFAFAAYGLSLVAILVSGYHCNTDTAYAALTLLAVYLMQERGRPFASGLALAAALNVKLLPIFLVPPLLAQSRSWRDLVRFSAGLALAIVPFVPFLITSGSAIYRNVVSYGSQQLDYGVLAFLNYATQTPAFAKPAGEMVRAYVPAGRYLILGAVIVVSAIAAARRRAGGYELGAVAWALFLVLTPGYGVQYAVCVVPLMFAADRRTAIVYSLCAGLMLFFIYTARMKLAFPLQASVQYRPIPPLAVLFGTLAWGSLVMFIATTVARSLRDRPREATR